MTITRGVNIQEIETTGVKMKDGQLIGLKAQLGLIILGRTSGLLHNP